MEELKRRADELWKAAWHQQMQGDLEHALELYAQSIDLFPTPEAHTYRGWALAHRGEYEEAIAECLRAIALDPELGNPYNDIGAYLIEQNCWSEAIPWLEKATAAPRYENYSFAWFNLGRVYEHCEDDQRALTCYRTAVRHNPEFDPATYAIRRLCARWN